MDLFSQSSVVIYLSQLNNILVSYKVVFRGRSSYIPAILKSYLLSSLIVLFIGSADAKSDLATEALSKIAEGSLSPYMFPFIIFRENIVGNTDSTHIPEVL